MTKPRTKKPPTDTRTLDDLGTDLLNALAAHPTAIEPMPHVLDQVAQMYPDVWLAHLRRDVGRTITVCAEGGCQNEALVRLSWHGGFHEGDKHELPFCGFHSVIHACDLQDDMDNVYVLVSSINTKRFL